MSLISLGDATKVAEPVGTVTITDAAVQRVHTLLTQKSLPDGALRVFVVGGGCSGFQYGMALANTVEPDDHVFERDGIKVVVDEDSIGMLRGAEVDYTEDIMKSGFTIFNPNAVKGCACGSSFQTAGGGGAPRACH